MRSSSYRFGKFDLRPSERRLLVNGEPVELGARAFDVLVALVESAGRMVHDCLRGNYGTDVIGDVDVAS